MSRNGSQLTATAIMVMVWASGCFGEGILSFWGSSEEGQVSSGLTYFSPDGTSTFCNDVDGCYRCVVDTTTWTGVLTDPSGRSKDCGIRPDIGGDPTCAQCLDWREHSGEYALSNEGLEGESGSCGLLVPGGFWATSNARWGCHAKLQVQMQDRCVVVEVLDAGPNVAAEMALGIPILDASPAAVRYLTNGQDAGWASRILINVQRVPDETQPGPVSCPDAGIQVEEPSPPAGDDPPEQGNSDVAAQCITDTGHTITWGECSEDVLLGAGTDVHSISEGSVAAIYGSCGGLAGQGVKVDGASGRYLYTHIIASVFVGQEVSYGTLIGTVWDGAGPIYCNYDFSGCYVGSEGPRLCWNGAHLHREGNCCSSDPGSDPPADSCGGLDYLGECAGDVVRWCENGNIREVDCAASGQVCAWENDTIGYNCLASSPPPPEPPPPAGPCGDPADWGRWSECAGNVVRWCGAAGNLYEMDCGECGCRDGRCLECQPARTDSDSDGVAREEGDCDDYDAAVHPGAGEACNGKDDNCNGQTDEGCVQPPAEAPQLTSPAPGSTIRETTPLLIWAAVPGAERYQVSIYQNGANLHGSFVEATRYSVPPGIMSPGNGYDIYLWAHNQAGFGPQGGAFAITVASNDPPQQPEAQDCVEFLGEPVCRFIDRSTDETRFEIDWWFWENESWRFMGTDILDPAGGTGSTVADFAWGAGAPPAGRAYGAWARACNDNGCSVSSDLAQMWF